MFHHVSISMVFSAVSGRSLLLLAECGTMGQTHGRCGRSFGHRKEEGMERNGNAMGNAMGNAVLSHGIVDDSGIFTGSN